MSDSRGAAEFRAVVDARHATELDRLLALPGLPTARDRTWHAVASVLLVTVDGQVLLARNRYGWGTVGGHVEDTDPALRLAVVREALEELGVLLDPEDLLPLSFIVDEQEVVPGCAHWDFCFVLPLAAPVAVTAQDDVRDAQWFPLDDLPEVNDHMRQHLDAVRENVAGQGLEGKHTLRTAVRGIVQRDGQLLLLRSGTRGDVKLPGGGVEPGESLTQALDRELREECGRRLVDCDPVLVTAIGSGADAQGAGMFTMQSHHVPCRITDALEPTALEGYEAELDLHPVWLTAEAAIEANESALAAGRGNPWTRRELAVLRHLRDAGIIA